MNNESMGSHIVVIGSPISGFSFTGPFNNAPEAIEVAERLFPNEDWWIAPLLEGGGPMSYYTVLIMLPDWYTDDWPHDAVIAIEVRAIHPREAMANALRQAMRDYNIDNKSELHPICVITGIGLNVIHFYEDLFDGTLDPIISNPENQ